VTPFKYALERNGRHFWITVIICTDGGTCWCIWLRHCTSSRKDPEFDSE